MSPNAFWKSLRSPLSINDKEIFISASIGIALGTNCRRHAEELVRDADIAMYRAKANGRASYAIFDPAMHQQVLQRLELENYLRRALDMEELVLYYQPIFSLTNLQVVGFETLLRWQHPNLGLGYSRSICHHCRRNRVDCARWQMDFMHRLSAVGRVASPIFCPGGAKDGS